MPLNELLGRLRSVAVLDDIEDLDIEIAKAEAQVQQLTALRSLLFPDDLSLPVADPPAGAPEPPPSKLPAKVEPASDGAPGASKKIPPGDLAEQLGALLREYGPKRSDFLSNKLGCTKEKLEEMRRHLWFEKAGPMWSLSSDGYVEFTNRS